MKIVHLRYTKEGKLLSKGGLTIAIKSNGDSVKIGTSLCISEDPFVRRKGYELAKNATSGYRSVTLSAKELDVALVEVATQRLGDNAETFLPYVSTWGLEKKAAYVMANMAFDMDNFPFAIDVSGDSGENVDENLNMIIKFFMFEMSELKKAVQHIDRQLNS